MISVVSVTNKKDNNTKENIFKNFKRQLYPNKELILIVNSHENVHFYKDLADKMEIKNCNIYGLHPFITLGECLNHSIMKMKGTYWAKMDDDDYYGENYLIEAHYNLINKGADLVGKKSIRLYNNDTKTMYDLNQSKNKYVTFVRGPTFFCHKSLFSDNETLFRFDKLNHGEDTAFLKKLIKHHKNIYATSEENFVYIRNTNLNQSSITPLNKYLGSKYKIIKMNIYNE